MDTQTKRPQTKYTRNAREVTLRLPLELAAQIDRVVAKRIGRAAAEGRVGRELPTRHDFLIAAVRAALRAEQARPNAQAVTP